MATSASHADWLKDLSFTPPTSVTRPILNFDASVAAFPPLPACVLSAVLPAFPVLAFPPLFAALLLPHPAKTRVNASTMSKDSLKALFIAVNPP
ncbi:hypothetical protein D3C81_1602130 [compost metagenome]